MDYWNTFYKTNDEHIQEPSEFCKTLGKYVPIDKITGDVFDCGCGNGRDTLNLAKTFHRAKQIIGVDNCGVSPIVPPEFVSRVTYLNESFVTTPKPTGSLVYSRFSLHSISDTEQEAFLCTIKPRSYVAIECRSDLGTTEKLVHGNNHYRNLVNLDRLCRLLGELNFTILHKEEGQGLAVYKTEDPYVLRVIAHN